MSAAAAERSRLAAIGVDLVGSSGGPGERRGAALLRRLAGRETAPVALADLPQAPAWLRLPHAAQRRLAERVALVAISPALARTIDGALLGEIAERLGEESLDAVTRAPIEGTGLPLVTGDRMAAIGFGLMRAGTPAALHGLLVEAELPDCDRAFAARCIDRALALEARA